MLLAEQLHPPGRGQHPHLQSGAQEDAIPDATAWTAYELGSASSSLVFEPGSCEPPEAVGRLFQGGGYVWVIVRYVMDTTV